MGRFRAWLKKKYGSLDALNEAWYRRFASWDEVQPNRLSTILSYTDYIDWKTFISEKLGEDLRERYVAVKAGAPGLVATSHAAGVGLFASPHYWEGQSDDWTMAAQVDLYGTSFYPKHSAFVDRDPVWRAALLDFTRSFGFADGRRGFVVGELQSGFGTIGVNVSPAVTAEDLRIWTWSALARGAKGVHYYAWYPMSTGYESGGFGMIQLDGTVTERAREAGRIAKVVAANEKLLAEARPAKAEVAIVYNPLSHFVGGRQRQAAYGGPQGEVAGIERDSLLGVYKALFPHNIPVAFVHAAHVTAESLRGYRLVYLPYPLMLPSSTAAVLRRYVEQGGRLVAEARPGWNDEHGHASETIPGMGLWEVFGARETAVETVPQGRTRIVFEGGRTAPARWFQETLEVTRTESKVVGRFENGAVAAVESRWGKGRTLLVGSYVSAAYQSTPTAEGAAWFAGLLEWAGVVAPLRVKGEVEVRWLESGGERIVFVFNHGAGAQHVELEWVDGSKWWAVMDLVSGAAAGLSFELEGKGVRVLRMRGGI